MKELFKDKKIKENVFTYSLTGIIVVLFAFILFKIKPIFNLIKEFIKIMSPFLWGIIFAFIMIRCANFIENKIIKDKLKFKTKRIISSIVATVILMIVIGLIIWIIIPQIVDSIKSLSNVILSFTNNAPSWINKLQKQLNLPSSVGTKLYTFFNDFISGIWPKLEESVPTIIDATFSAVNGIINFVIGFIVAIYILNERDELRITFKKLGLVFLKEKNYEYTKHIYHLSVQKFNQFFIGKVYDSLIVGLICIVFMLVAKLDYAILISVIVCITNMIPFFGPFIGAIPSAIILFIVDPIQSLIFIIFIFILQQIDGNIIGPKILGDSVGLSSLWIMFALTIGGGYFGLLGMLLGVPIFAVIYFSVKEYVNDKLNKKNKSKTTKNKAN